MNILICPDSFKGSLRAMEVADLIADSLLNLDRSLNCKVLPLADGGEGTSQILASTLGAKIVKCEVSDPLGRIIGSQYYLSPDRTAIIEMATASGWELLTLDELDPLKADSTGTGELLKHAVSNGAKKILLAVGGSATNDGGMGMACALGAKFLDQDGNELDPCGANLVNVCSIDTSGLLTMPPIDILHDVDNTLLGPSGSTYTFGPQKGASDEDLVILEQGMESLNTMLSALTGRELSEIHGMGAAGGIGLCATSLFGARLTPGSETVAQITQLEKHLQRSDLVITGEGRLDEQSLHGKITGKVFDLSKRHQKELIVICGSSELELIPGNLYIISLTEIAGPDRDPLIDIYSVLEDAAKKAYSLFSSR